MEGIIIRTTSQDEKKNVKISQKSLKVLQQTANNDNLAGGPFIDKLTLLKGNDEFNSKQTENKEVQVREGVISAEDLAWEDPGVKYWKILAEAREKSLYQSLNENEQLKCKIWALEDENSICKQRLNESRIMVEVLQEMLIYINEDSLRIAKEAESSSRGL